MAFARLSCCASVAECDGVFMRTSGDLDAGLSCLQYFGFFSFITAKPNIFANRPCNTVSGLSCDPFQFGFILTEAGACFCVATTADSLRNVPCCARVQVLRFSNLWPSVSAQIVLRLHGRTPLVAIARAIFRDAPRPSVEAYAHTA